MTNDITTPHNNLFEKVWGDIEHAKDFFSTFLYKEQRELYDKLDFKTLSLVKDSFIDENLKAVYSDILYTVKLKDREPAYIYLLMEHKSTLDKFTPLQLLKYMLNIWIDYKEKNNKLPLPIIIPMVLYHGKEKWTIGTNFASLFDVSDSNLSKYIVDFSFLLWDVSKKDDQEIKNYTFTGWVLLLFKYVFTKEFHEKLPEVMELFNEMQSKDTGFEGLSVLLKYIFSVTEKDRDELIKIISPKLERGKEEAMVLADRLIQQGREEAMVLADRLVKQGKEEGLKQGEIKGKLEMAKAMKYKGFDTSMIMELSGLPKQQIDSFCLAEAPAEPYGSKN